MCCAGLMLLLLTIGCSQSTRTRFENLAITNQVTIPCRLKQVSTLEISIKGEVRGTGIVHVPFYFSNVVSGKISTNLSRDWYERSCTLKYEPIGSTTGWLKFKVVFDRF